MTTDLVHIAHATGYEASKVQLVKDTIARGASDDELMLFLSLAQRSGLDPFSRQIYLIERRQNIDGQWKTTRQPQTGIDGLRLIADRTGNYAPGRAPSYEYDADGQLHSATAYVQKFVRDRWHEIAATAHYAEYVQMAGKGNERRPTQMWADKPHIMLAKCAEALALRRAFPADMSGLYTSDEIPAPEPPTLVAEPVRQITTKPPEALPDVERLQRDCKALRECERAIGLPLPNFGWNAKKGPQPLKDEIAASRGRLIERIPGLLAAAGDLLEGSDDAAAVAQFHRYATLTGDLEMVSHADLIEMASWLFAAATAEAEVVEEAAL